MSSPKKNLPRPLQLLFDYSGFLLLGTAAALLWANLDPGSESTPGTYSRFIHFEPFAALTGNRHDAHENGHDGEHANGEHSATTEHARGDAAQPADSTEQSDSTEQVADDSQPADESEQDVATDESTEAEPAAHAAHGRWTLHFLVTDLLMALFFAIAAKEVWEAMLPGGALSNLRKAATPLLATLGGVVGPAAIYVAGLPTSRSVTWRHGSFSARDTRPSRFCFCWPSPTMPRDWSSSPCFIPTRRCP
jgi:NhaA family Na+:H+ antiporter